jgi:hypothetical protein
MNNLRYLTVRGDRVEAIGSVACAGKNEESHALPQDIYDVSDRMRCRSNYSIRERRHSTHKAIT